MNVPINTREFSLEMAKQSHPLVTRDGRKAKFIAYVPDVIDSHKLVVQIGDGVVRYHVDGCIGMNHWDLFLAPLGHVEGMPVFAGDKLIGPCGDITAEPYMTEEGAFGLAKWPSKAPVVETSLSEIELHNIEYETMYAYNKTIEDARRNLANKAIERSIKDGDVIPTSLFRKMAGEAYGDVGAFGTGNFDKCAKRVLRDYLEGLK